MNLKSLVRFSFSLILILLINNNIEAQTSFVSIARKTFLCLFCPQESFNELGHLYDEIRIDQTTGEVFYHNKKKNLSNLIPLQYFKDSITFQKLDSLIKDPGFETSNYIIKFTTVYKENESDSLSEKYKIIEKSIIFPTPHHCEECRELKRFVAYYHLLINECKKKKKRN